MGDGRLLLDRLARALGEGVALEDLPARACTEAVLLLGCDGGAVTVGYSTPERVTVCATEGVARAVEEYQETTTEGPGHEAFRTGAYTRLELGRRRGAADERWPLLTATPLTRLAPIVVHALPLLSHGRSFGVLTLVQLGERRVLDEGAATDLALVVSSVVLACVAEPDDGLPESWEDRAEVHQATGMVVAQLALSGADALALIRAHAYREGVTVHEAARRVVRRWLVFRRTRGEAIEST